MVSIRTKILAGALVMMASLVTAAHANQAGKVTQITGEVSIIRKADQAEPLKLYDPVFEGDTLQTGADGRIKVLLSDDSVITLSPGTKLKVRTQTFNRAEAKRESFFELMQGRLRAAVARYSSRHTNSFQIKTPTAVAGVRGSIQVVGTGGGNDFMACVEGPCTYGTPGNEVTLQSGQISFMQGGSPTEPRTPTADELQSLINSTIFANYGGDDGGDLPGADDPSGVDGGEEAGEFPPLNMTVQVTRERPALDLEPAGGGRPRAKVRIDVPFRP